MAIEFLCGSCRRQIRVSDAVAGKRGKCPHCGVVVQVPAVSAPSAGAAAPKPRSSSGATAANSTVAVTCPSCQQTIMAPASLVGQKGMCPHCQTVLIVGGSGNANPSGLTPLGNSPAGYSTPAGAGASPLGDIFSPSGGGYDPLGGLPAYSPQQPSYPAYGPAAPATNPFGYSPSTPAWGGTPVGNPYESPAPSGYAGGYAGYSSGYGSQSTSGPWAPAKLMIPATLMLLVAVLSTGARILAALGFLVTPPPFLSSGDERGVVVFQVMLVTSTAIAVVVNIGVTAGAVQALRLRSFNLARIAAILACLPCSELCINVIFGVWVLIVLHLPDVRRRFE